MALSPDLKRQADAMYDDLINNKDYSPGEAQAEVRKFIDKALGRQPSRPAPARQPERTEAPVKAERGSSSEWALGLALLVFGALGWLAGNKYTLAGWITGLNLFAAWVGVSERIPLLSGWSALIIGGALGFAYSRVETRIWHRRNGLLMRSPLFWIGWLIIVLSDVGTTYLGVRTPSADSWAITKQVAESQGAAAVWAAVLTFAPEWMILGGMRYLPRWLKR